MNALSRLQAWWHDLAGINDPPWDANMPSWLASLVVHLCILVGLLMIGTLGPMPLMQLTIETSPSPAEELLAVSDQFSYSEAPQEAIGASLLGDATTMIAEAPLIGIPLGSPGDLDFDADTQPDTQRLKLSDEIHLATGTRFAENLSIKGIAGMGATGTGGAIDRITQEILLSLEERRTLVVWLFDQSGSLARQRAEIIKRFDHIYDELGVIEASGNPAFSKYEDKPLLSTVVSFGQNVSFLTRQPTDDVEQIKAAVNGIKTDESGIERVFGAVFQAAERYKTFRTQDPRRNVMFVIFSDEVGDDEQDLDRDVALCRRYEIPVYCVGVPAPFGRQHALIKYVDPDPKYDQSPQWVPVRQGPESFLPELVNFGAEEDVEPMDSGFGPYSLTRLCYETGGIFFALHPNRNERRAVGRGETAVLSAQLNRFFDPEVMRNYRPDYVPIKEYQKLLSENKARAALVEAAQLSWVVPMERPQLVFPKSSDADLANRLSQAQRSAAVVEPKINQLHDILKQGEKDRPTLTKARWQAGYDVSMGRVLAAKVRTEGYNAMLAKAKQGMRFEDPNSDTWRLVPSSDVSVSSALEKLAAEADRYLKRAAREHPGTPWAHLAEKELNQPMGWKWTESYTGVNAPPRVAANNNNNNRRPPQDDKARTIPRPEKRPPPKL